MCPAWNDTQIKNDIDFHFWDFLIVIKFLLAAIPLQLKEKRRQIFLKTTTEGRQRAKQKRVEEELEQEKKNQEEEERRL